MTIDRPNPEPYDELVVRCEFDLAALGTTRDPMTAVAEECRRAADENAAAGRHRLRASEPLRIKGWRAVEAVTGRDVFLVETVWATDKL